MTNPGRFSTGLVLPFTHKRTNPKWKLPGLVISPEILNPEFKVGTLNPKTFESGEFCRVNGFLLNRLSNPDIFPLAILWACGKTKMEDLVLTLLAVSGCVILLQVQAINFIMCTAMFLRKRKLLSQASLTSATLNCRLRRWQDRRPIRFWVRPGRTSAWWDNMMDNVTVASEWKENLRKSHPTFIELCEDLRPLLKRKSTRMRRPISVETQMAVTLY